MYVCACSDGASTSEVPSAHPEEEVAVAPKESDEVPEASSSASGYVFNDYHWFLFVVLTYPIAICRTRLEEEQ